MKGHPLAAISASRVMGMVGALLVVIVGCTARLGHSAADVERAGAATLPDASTSVYPPPATTRNFDLGPPGWHSLVWTGSSRADPTTALACIDASYGVAYRWLNSSQAFEQSLPDKPDISDMDNLNKYDLLLVLITDSDVQCVGTPVEP
jgi:hypothetical protein